MKANAGQFRIGWMAQALDVSTSGYYVWRKRPESSRERENRMLAVEIKAVHAASRQTYGNPRIHAELAAKGISCSRGRVCPADEETGRQGRAEASIQDDH